MRRLARIYRAFVASSVQRELEFRANFFAKCLQSSFWIFFFVMIIFVIYGRTSSVAGWSRGEAMVLAATVLLIASTVELFFTGLNEMPQMVRQGTLDFVVTRPIDSQLWVSFRKLNLAQIGPLFAQLGMLGYGISTLDRPPSLPDWLGWLAAIGFGMALFYGFQLALTTSSVWFVRIDNLFILSETATQIARFPIDIYGLGVQRILTFGLPLALIGTVPARQLVRGFDAGPLLIGLAWAAVALVGSRLFWRHAARAYASASS